MFAIANLILHGHCQFIIRNAFIRFINIKRFKNYIVKKNEHTNAEFNRNNDIYVDQNIYCSNEFNEDFDDSLIDQYEKRNESKAFNHCMNTADYKSGVLLLSILRKAKAPLYLFDEIISWAKKAQNCYNINFLSTQLTRQNVIEEIKLKYELHRLDPTTKTIFLKSINENVNVICHDFKQCLYSLLTDIDIMKKENLLEQNCNDKISDDINSGCVFKNAFKALVKDSNKELLLPIIFLLTKHTLTLMDDCV